MENCNKIIGKNLSSLREKMGMNQNELAEMLGVKREIISYYETGSREVPIILLEKLADFFRVDLADLMENKPEIQKTNIAFAFRANEFCREDFESIAHFGKIVRNYFKLKELYKALS
ncbi:MAG: helix-turn-helix transcriptional regulator [Bacteroidia bacterium]|nr:helix-turn-helix transcriptional regulator [Bacteroidia bacterium]